MNLTTFAVAKGIKLSKPDTNLLTKLETDYRLLLSDNEPETVVAVNPLGGSVTTSPLVAILHRFVLRAYASYGYTGTLNYNGKPVNVAFFDRVRYLILKLDKTAYAELID